MTDGLEKLSRLADGCGHVEVLSQAAWAGAKLPEQSPKNAFVREPSKISTGEKNSRSTYVVRSAITHFIHKLQPPVPCHVDNFYT